MTSINTALHKRNCRLMMIACLLVIVLLRPVSMLAQTTSLPTCYDINQTKLVDTISKNMEIAFLSADSAVEQYYHTLHFIVEKDDRKKIPDDLVPKTAIVRFTVCNTGDTVKGVYFFPGYYF